MTKRILVIEDTEGTRAIPRHSARIKSDPDLAPIPVIAVKSSHALPSDAAEAIAAGCAAYVTKLFSPRAVLAEIREFLPCEFLP